jgi:dTDP-L-rhamnose 4-epimerase
MKVLVTGGAGFIGSYVCRQLLRDGHEVVILDNLDPQIHPSGEWPDYLPQGVEKYLGDVRDRSLLSTLLDNADAVIHLAAAVGVGQSMYAVEHYTSVSVLGTAILLEEIIQRKESIRKLIVASSMSIYGEGLYETRDRITVDPPSRERSQLEQKQWELSDTDGHPLHPIPTSEDKKITPESIYAINKRDQEEMCLVIGKAYNIPTVAFRMFNVYGPFQALSNPYTGVAAIFSARLLGNQSPLIFEDGHQKRDFVYAEDVARAYAMALTSSAADGKALNLGSGQSITILEIAETIARLMQKDIAPTVTSNFREGDIRHCFADITQIKTLLGWEPEFTFEQGMQKLIGWLSTQNEQNDVAKAHEELLKKGLLK